MTKRTGGDVLLIVEVYHRVRTRTQDGDQSISLHPSSQRTKKWCFLRLEILLFRSQLGAFSLSEKMMDRLISNESNS